MALLCRNARLIDPQVGLDEVCDLLVDGQRIEKVGHDIDPAGAEVRDLMGKVIIPGLVSGRFFLRRAAAGDGERGREGAKHQNPFHLHAS